VDTSAFYGEDEQKIHRKLLKAYNYRNRLKKLDGNYTKNKKYISERISTLKNKLIREINKNDDVRNLRQDSLKKSNVISLFDSVLTRVLKIEQNTLSEDIFVVQAYYFQVLESIIKNGFIHNDEKYVYLTSSAGQIRTKRSIFIKESLWNQHKETLMCGLSVEDINNLGGVNINKYQAYLALSNSATDEWKNFNIHRSIVVDDLETKVHSLVDYINRETYEITRQEMDIPIEHTDGAGIILPRKSKKSFMCRLPWIKGLLVPFPFDKFADEHKSHIVKDIYGKEWDIFKDKIEVIFTKSQFKMWKYYKDWDDYKEKFTKHQCQAARLNEEDVSADANINYQMIQTLTDMTDEELTKISQDTVQDILKIGSDKETMLRVIGATETNKRKNYFQQALSFYPELLNDEHSKQVIKDKKKRLIRDARSGKLNVKGKYTFLCPDLYAFCERLFLGIKQPNGLLKKGEVYCDIFDTGKVDCLRAPHLYREHGVRENVLDEVKSKWFITHGIYTSVHDPISKMLQFDNDGDKSLVIQDEVLVSVAERNMKGIVPLYYEMAKAPAEQINSEDIYKSLVSAYKANIGEISNNITKIWNSDNVNLDVIKWLCMENNFTIDFAKTLYIPSRPKEVNDIISKYIKAKVPHFFVYAKDKEEKNVEIVNDSVVNRLNYIVPNKSIQFKRIAGELDYKILINRDNVNLNSKIIKTYARYDKNKRMLMNKKYDLDSNEVSYFYKALRNDLLSVNDDPEYVTDVLVKYLYETKNSKHKTTLWNTFGDILVKNIRQNLKNTKQCESCGDRIEEYNTKKYCDKCAIEKEKIRKREWKRNRLVAKIKHDNP
jgi:ribosomal protein L37E